MATSRTTRWFLFCEIACLFLFSIWWRKGIPVEIGIAVGAGHLFGLVVLLRLWERWYRLGDLGESASEGSVLADGGFPLVVILAIAAGLQLMYLDDPVLSGPDESVLLIDHFVQVDLFRSMHWMLQAGFVVCCAGLWAVSVRLTRALPVSGQSKVVGAVSAVFAEIRQKVWLIGSLVLLIIVYGWLESRSPFLWGLAERWPPFGTVLSMPFQMVLTEKVLAIRLTSLLFYLGVGYLVYLIAFREFGQWPAIASLTLTLLAPVFFLYGHYGFREMGGVFFLTLGVCFLHALLRTRNADLYGLVIASATLGYFQRRPSILLLLVAAIVLLWVYRMRLFRWQNLRMLAVPVLCSIWIVLPWYLISANVRPYISRPGNLLELAAVAGYPAAMPLFLGWPFTLLCAIGLAAGIRYRSRLVLILAVWLLLFNLLFAMDVTAPEVVQRFYIQFLPPLGLLVGAGFLWISKRVGSNRSVPVQSAIAIGIVVLAAASLLTWAVDDHRRVPLQGIRYVSQPLYPYPALVRDLQDNNQRAVLYQPLPWQSALPVYLKTRRPTGISLKMAPWTMIGQDITLANAITDCRQAMCTHLVEPIKRSGEFLFHEGEFVGAAEALAEITSVHEFSSRHGGVALIKLAR